MVIPPLAVLIQMAISVAIFGVGAGVAWAAHRDASRIARAGVCIAWGALCVVVSWFFR